MKIIKHIVLDNATIIDLIEKFIKNVIKEEPISIKVYQIGDSCEAYITLKGV